MPIMWIREGSPLAITVVSDDGEKLASMEVPEVSGKDAVWRISDLEDPHPSNPVYEKGFRMRREKGNRAVLRIEFTEPSEEYGKGR